jgi:DNA adenine methylase
MGYMRSARLQVRDGDLLPLFQEGGQLPAPEIPPLLKWIGSKHRVAAEIISYFPARFRTYHEPFVGTGAVLGALAPPEAKASDVLKPLVEIWLTLKSDPELLLSWYRKRWQESQKDRQQAYEQIKARFNRHSNPADLLFLSRTCYGGVIRFRRDGYMSTPIGIHDPIRPESMAKRINAWHRRTAGAEFHCADFEEAMEEARSGDLIYCDPPYSDTQAIIYGAQNFSLDRLCRAIEKAKTKGAKVALSIDGHKKSGGKVSAIRIPKGVFERSVLITCGRSMLRRFQMQGQTLESEVVADRLLLTW